MDSTKAAALAGIRVLEVSAPIGNYCGKLFADMGAEVVLVEPPGGSAGRFEPPFAKGASHPEASLAFAYYNAGKRGITLDLDTESGRKALRKLAREADLLIDTEKPGVMPARGLGYEVLRADNPRLVVASLTAFGQTGPYAQYESEDIVGLALGGLLSLGGYADAAPIRAHGNQAWLCASMYGAVAALMAVMEAERTGLGQHVDVSMQECLVMALENAVQFYELEGVLRKRHAGEQRFAGTGVFKASDGFIYLMAGGVGGNKFWPISIRWFLDEGVAEAAELLEPHWMNTKFLRTQEAKDRFHALVAPWIATKTKAYLYHEGQRRRIPIAPISAPRDLLANPQLAHRGHFVESMLRAAGKPVRMPGAPYKLTATPWKPGAPAPTLGEHNAEILGAKEAA